MNKTTVIKLLRATRIAFCVSLCWTVVTRAQQETLVEFSPEEARSHWIGASREIHTDHPLGPRSMFDAVTLRVIVTPFGRVESAKALEGPKQFYAEAEQIEMEREFRPFEKDGTVVRASIKDYVRILPPVQWAANKVPFQEIKDLSSLRIKLERTSCFGMCPAYSVEIRGDGSITFDGGLSTLISGVHRGKISDSAVTALVNKFRRADYFSLKDQYKTDVTDNPTSTTSIEFDGYRKQVVDYAGLESGMPEIVMALENGIDEAAETAKWLKETDQTWPSLLAENWDFKTQSEENHALFANVVRLGSNDLIQKFLSAGAPANWYSENGEGPLVNAAAKGDADMVSRMLMRQEPLSAPVLFLALRAAAKSGSLETVDLLLQKGATVNDSSIGSADQETVLMAAAGSGKLAIVDEILQHYSDPKKVDLDASLTSALHAGNADVVEEILKYHPSVSGKDDQGNNVLATFLADSNGGSDTERIIRALVAAGADVNGRNRYGQPVIFKACYNAVAVKSLAVLGADVNAKDNRGDTALMTCGRPEFAKAMIVAGADLSIQNKDGLTAAQHARKIGQPDLADVLETAMKPKQ